MGEERETKLIQSITPSTSNALTRRSATLVTRGVRHLEFLEQSEQKQVFVVDDEEAVREIICAMLTSAGFRCKTFSGGLDALALLESGEQCDLLVTDLLNYPLDGLSLLERVKQKYPTVEVVVASAVHDDSVTEHCIRSGAFLYLRHPVGRAQLLDAVNLAIEHHRFSRISTSAQNQLDAKTSL